MAEVISSGHSLDVRGAAGFIEEVNEARAVVKRVVKYLKELGETVYEFHDDTSKTQNENLRTIVKFHNSKTRKRDWSVHFNAGGGEGTEVLHYGPKTKDEATALSKVISDALGTKDRGPKERPNLYFLNSTEEEGLLLEICFVDSKSDVEKYRKNFDKMCRAIAEHIAGKKLKVEEPVKPVSKPTTNKPTAAKTMYRVVTGSFAERENAEKRVKELKAKGFDSFLDAYEK